MSFRKTLRALHRDLGYLFVGLSLIYAISGIILVLKPKEKDPAFKEIRVEQTLEKNLTPDEITAQWKSVSEDIGLNRVIPYGDIYRVYLKGGIGEYNPQSGHIHFTTYRERPVVKFMNQVHYNTGKKFTWLGIIYAVTLIFFTLSGAIMLKGKTSFLKRGWWITLIGIIAPVIWYLIVF